MVRAVVATCALALLLGGPASAAAGTHAGAWRPAGLGPRIAHAPWGSVTDGVRGSALVYGRGTVMAQLHGNAQLDAIADDIVGASDMTVALEDDPIEWASFLGPGSEDVLGFVIFAAPPSPLYHAILLGPLTYPAWQSWIATGTPAGDEFPFAVAAMSLIHESYHWKLMSGDESTVNACALRDFGYYLAKDFNVPATVTQTTTQQVPQTVTKRVPTTKTVVTKKRVKVHGRWVTRTVRKRVTTYVTKTSTVYVTQSVETTVANPLYQTLVSDAQSFYNSQPPPYNSGSCSAPAPGSTPAPPPPPPPTPAAAYHVKACWTQYTGGSWSTADPTAATTSFSAADILTRGASNFWAVVTLDEPPTTTFAGTTISLIEPRGVTFYTATLSQPWTPSYIAWSSDFTGHWKADNTLFFQHPELSGTGAWTFRWSFPDGESCSSSFTVS